MTIIGDLIIADIKVTSNAAINIINKVRNTFLKSITKSAQDATINTLDIIDRTAAIDTAVMNDKYKYNL